MTGSSKPDVGTVCTAECVVLRKYNAAVPRYSPLHGVSESIATGYSLRK